MLKEPLHLQKLCMGARTLPSLRSYASLALEVKAMLTYKVGRRFRERRPTRRPQADSYAAA